MSLLPLNVHSFPLQQQGPDCKPTIQKAIIVCPASLVKVRDNRSVLMKPLSLVFTELG